MADKDRLTNTLIELIKIDSPSGEEDAIDREVSARLSRLGLEVTHDGYNNIIAYLPGNGEQCCCRPTWTRWSPAAASSR